MYPKPYLARQSAGNPLLETIRRLRQDKLTAPLPPARPTLEMEQQFSPAMSSVLNDNLPPLSDYGLGKPTPPPMDLQPPQMGANRPGSDYLPTPGPPPLLPPELDNGYTPEPGHPGYSKAPERDYGKEAKGGLTGSLIAAVVGGLLNGAEGALAGGAGYGGGYQEGATNRFQDRLRQYGVERENVDKAHTSGVQAARDANAAREVGNRGKVTAYEMERGYRGERREEERYGLELGVRLRQMGIQQADKLAQNQVGLLNDLARQSPESAQAAIAALDKAGVLKSMGLDGAFTRRPDGTIDIGDLGKTDIPRLSVEQQLATRILSASQQGLAMATTEQERAVYSRWQQWALPKVAGQMLPGAPAQGGKTVLSAAEKQRADDAAASRQLQKGHLQVAWANHGLAVKKFKEELKGTPKDAKEREDRILKVNGIIAQANQDLARIEGTRPKMPEVDEISAQMHPGKRDGYIAELEAKYRGELAQWEKDTQSARDAQKRLVEAADKQIREMNGVAPVMPAGPPPSPGSSDFDNFTRPPMPFGGVSTLPVPGMPSGAMVPRDGQGRFAARNIGTVQIDGRPMTVRRVA